MSEQEQQHFDTSGADVSRETLSHREPEKSEAAEEITPEQQMLYDIIDRSMAKSQERQAGENTEDPAPPREEPEQEQQDSPPPPQKNKPSSFYVYLAVLFGAAFLMLLLAYFVQQRNNATAMDDLRMTNNASREELLEDIKALEAERDRLQKEVEYQKGRVTQKNEETERLQSNLENSNSRWSDQHIQTITLKYFWYIDQFMKNRDYPMAAAAVLFQADSYRETWNTQVDINPVQVEQYEAYRQELIDRGYLEERLNISTLDHLSPTNLCFTQKWDPSQNDETAALCNLWCALNGHFVFEDDDAAAQYLFYYPLGRPETGYQDYVSRLASDFTLEQFQIMKDELTEDWYITVLVDGSIIKNYSASQTDERYVLPFQLPETESWKYTYYG